MSHDILARLEAVAARLEGYASAVASGAVHSSNSSSSSSSGSSASIPREVEDYDHFYNDAVVPFIEAAKKSKDTEEIAAWAEQSFQFVRRAILASKQCKKPNDQELTAFCAPLTKALDSCQKCSRKVPQHHAKAVPEAFTSATWIAQGGNARQFCQDQLEAADYHLMRILKEGKENNKPEFTEFATKLKQLLQKQKTFVDDNFRQGLEWNPKGAPLSSFQDSGSAPAHGHSHGHGHGDSGAGAPPPPPGPPGDIFDPPGPPGPPGAPTPSKPSSGGTAGMGAVFAELTGKGDGVTCGLKKVTKAMKADLKAAPPLEAKKKEVAPAKKWGAGETKAAEVKKEPKLYLSKGTHFVEHHEGGTVTIPNVELKENVYIMKCKNVTVIIPDKCKSIQIDGCVRTHVQFKSVVSLAEIFNSQRCTIDCTETVPSVAIDKSAGCQIILSRQGVATPPDIITSSVSELNLVVPGKTDDDDPIEIPLPEQYITKYKGGMTLVTEPVTHGSNG